MRNWKKAIVTFAVALFTAATMTSTVYAAGELMKDGQISNGFINAGEQVDGAVQGPGNWTQLNMGDTEVTQDYLHIVMKASGDTALAEIVVSDTASFKLADLGITLTEEYQDVVLPVAEKDLTVISWMNFTGLDGGSSVYQIKDIFLSADANSTIGAPTVQEEQQAEVDLPKTGESTAPVIIAILAMVGAGAIYILTNKKKIA